MHVLGLNSTSYKYLRLEFPNQWCGYKNLSCHEALSAIRMGPARLWDLCCHPPSAGQAPLPSFTRLLAIHLGSLVPPSRSPTSVCQSALLGRQLKACRDHVCLVHCPIAGT